MFLVFWVFLVFLVFLVLVQRSCELLSTNTIFCVTRTFHGSPSRFYDPLQIPHRLHGSPIRFDRYPYRFPLQLPLIDFMDAHVDLMDILTDYPYDLHGSPYRLHGPLQRLCGSLQIPSIDFMDPLINCMDPLIDFMDPFGDSPYRFHGSPYRFHGSPYRFPLLISSEGSLDALSGNWTSREPCNSSGPPNWLDNRNTFNLAD